jgi:H+/Cl- antiporter ClcA
MALMVMISSKKNLQPWNTYSGGEFLVLWLIVVLVPIVVVFFVWLGSANVSLTQQLFCYDHDQQQTTLVTSKHTQGDGCMVFWLIVVSVAIVVVLCVVWALETRDV